MRAATVVGAAAIAAGMASAAGAQDVSPIPRDSPAAVANATIDTDLTNMQGTEVDRMNEAARAGRRIDLNVGQVPNVRTPPPSNDRAHNPRTRTESSWTTQQRGTGATGLWPMPSTGGQPGTLQ